jgi:16S rRNA (cytosine967-C5)-methyltransferase
VFQLAEEVIAKAQAEHRPADEVLREFFRETGRDSTEGSIKERLPSKAVARVVFDYYRWRGWTEPGEPLVNRLRKSSDMASRFETNYKDFADEELLHHAIPEWIWDEMKVTVRLVRAFQAQPKLWLRARKGQGAAVAASLGNCRVLGSGPLADALEYLGSQDIFRTEAFRSGLIQIQDASSQAVGWLCNPAPSQTWWDACAGEGGKTLHLSDLMDNKGTVWASDRAEWRLKRLRSRAARSGVFNYRLAKWDGGPKLPVKTRFDGVLVDAPCSGVGTWGRNPHSRWSTTRGDVKELAELQLKLLSHASAAVKPGGCLVYSVCTLTRSETDAVADRFQSMCKDFTRLKLPNPVDAAKEATARHWFMPQDFGGNGMFVASWVRTSSAI